MNNRKYQILFALTISLILIFTLLSPTLAAAPANMYVHFIDVGQGDSELIISPGGKTVLIDGGEREAGPKVVDFLRSKGVKKIDILISTHAHEDHIGGLREVLRQFPVGLIIDSGKKHTTATYKAYLKMIIAKNIKLTLAKTGTTYDLGGGAKLQIVYCNPNAEDLNNSSVVAKVTYGQVSALFMGDLESAEEGNINTRADILKVGHHGSRTSTSDTLLRAVKPKEAIISCGTNNQYGHPHDVTMKRLASYGIKTYRTDKSGNITLTTDGKSYTISAKPSGFAPVPVSKIVKQKSEGGSSSGSGSYIGNKNSHKFHRANCSRLPAEKNRVYFKSRDEAIKTGYEPCKICEP